jgi:hypothetical protein
MLVGFFLLGIGSTWLSMRLMERIDWSRWTWHHAGCWESGPCTPPGFAAALLVAYLLLPLLAHLAVGARTRPAGWPLRKVVLTIFVSLASTLAFHGLMRLAMGH